MTAERYEAWNPVEGIERPAGGIEVSEKGYLTLRLLFSTGVDASPQDLIVEFLGGVPAYMAHEEFVHPWNEVPNPNPVPRLSGRWSNYGFPCLKVHDSAWLTSFSEPQLASFPDCIHFRFLSLDKTIDVLTIGPVEAHWAPASNSRSDADGNAPGQPSR